MITPELYSKSIAALKGDRSKLSDDEFETLVQVAEQYQKENATRTERAPSFGVEGPVGMDMLERKIQPPPSLGTSPMAKSLDPLMGSIRSAQAAAPAAQSAGPIAGDTDEEKRAADIQARKEHDAARNEKLASASQVTDLYQPPEFIPPGLSALDALPSTFGGKVDHYVEPGLSQFQRDMAGVYPNIHTLDEGSLQYKQYADAQWKAIYERAQAEGRPVVRMEYAKSPLWTKSFGDRAFMTGMQGIGMAASAAHGADDAAFAGMGGRLTDTHENGQLLEAANPGSALTGRILGGVNPRSIGNVAARGVAGGLARALPGAVPLTESTLGSALASGGKGAVAAGTDSLANDAADYALDDRGNVKPEGDRGDFDWRGAEKRAAQASLFGGALGAGADLTGQLAGLPGKALRREQPFIEDAERIGGRTEASLRGFKPGKDYEALAKRARAAGTEPPELVAGELAPKLVGEGREITEDTKAAIERDVQAYYKQTEGVRRPATALTDSLMQQHTLRTDGAGNDLRQNGGIRDLLGMVSDVEAVDGDPTTAFKAAQADVPGARMLDAAAAAKAGVDVSGAMRRFAQKNGISGQAAQILSPDDFHYVVTPRPYTPEEFDQVVEHINDVAKAGGKPDPTYTPFLKSSRQVRDTFPEMGPADGKAYPLEDGTVLTGWSALKQEHADLTQDTRDTLASAGMQREPGTRPDLNTRRGAFNAAMNYAENRRGTMPEETARLKELASGAGEGPTLEGLRGTKSMEKAQDAAAIHFGGRHVANPAHVSLGNLRMRIDPALSTLALPSGSRSFEPGIRPDRGSTANPFRLRGGNPGGAGYAAAGRRSAPNTLTPEEAAALKRVFQFEGGAL